jgi:hypothetical protein
MPATLPYGTWPSAITSELLVEQVVRLGDVDVAGDEVWWNEGRPAEAGRQVLVSARPGQPGVDRLTEGFSARTAVHEYGGTPYALLPGEDGGTRVVFAHWADQRLWLIDPGQDPVPLTPAPAVPRGDRYADLAPVPGGRWLLAVRERHATTGSGGLRT